MTARRRSPRSPRETIRQREDRQHELIAALFDSVEPVQRDLGDRLHRCQQAREARRGWRDLRDAVSGGYPFRCRLFSCWACRRSIVRRWKDEARRQFKGAENSECSTVSIVLARTTQVEVIREIVAKARKDFSNLRAGMYRQSGGWRWRSILAFGMVETDAVAFDDVALLGPDRVALLPSLPLAASGGSEWWLPCAHLAVQHPHLDRAELARSVMRRWPGSKRVDVQPFDDHQPAVESAAGVVRRALEGSGPLGFGGGGARWPPPRRANFHSWLFSLKRGLQPLGMSLRPGREIDGPYAADTWKLILARFVSDSDVS